MKYAINAWLGHQPTKLSLIDADTGNVVAEVEGGKADRLVEEYYPELFNHKAISTHELIRSLFLQACINNNA